MMCIWIERVTRSHSQFFTLMFVKSRFVDLGSLHRDTRVSIEMSGRFAHQTWHQFGLCRRSDEMKKSSSNRLVDQI